MTFSWSPTPLSTTWSSVLIRLVSADTDTMRKYIARNWQIAYMKISEHSYNTMFGWMFSDLLGLIMSCYPLYLESLMYNWKKSVYLPWNVHSDYSVQLQPSPPCQSEVNPLYRKIQSCFFAHGTFPRALFAKWRFMHDECNRLGQGRKALRCRSIRLQVKEGRSVCDARWTAQ